MNKIMLSDGNELPIIVSDGTTFKIPCSSISEYKEILKKITDSNVETVTVLTEEGEEYEVHKNLSIESILFFENDTAAVTEETCVTTLKLKQKDDTQVRIEELEKIVEMQDDAIAELAAMVGGAE